MLALLRVDVHRRLELVDGAEEVVLAAAAPRRDGRPSPPRASSSPWRAPRRRRRSGLAERRLVLVAARVVEERAVGLATRGGRSSPPRGAAPRAPSRPGDRDDSAWPPRSRPVLTSSFGRRRAAARAPRTGSRVSTTVALALDLLAHAVDVGRPLVEPGHARRRRHAHALRRRVRRRRELDAPDGILYAPDASVGSAAAASCDPASAAAASPATAFGARPDGSRTASADAAVAFGGSGVSRALAQPRHLVRRLDVERLGDVERVDERVHRLRRQARPPRRDRAPSSSPCASSSATRPSSGPDAVARHALVVERALDGLAVEQEERARAAGRRSTRCARRDRWRAPGWTRSDSCLCSPWSCSPASNS